MLGSFICTVLYFSFNFALCHFIIIIILLLFHYYFILYIILSYILILLLPSFMTTKTLLSFTKGYLYDTLVTLNSKHI